MVFFCELERRGQYSNERSGASVKTARKAGERRWKIRLSTLYILNSFKITSVLPGTGNSHWFNFNTAFYQMSITHHQKDIDKLFSWEDGRRWFGCTCERFRKGTFLLGGGGRGLRPQRGGLLVKESFVSYSREGHTFSSNFFSEDMFYVVLHFSFYVLWFN